ncbi:MAG: glycosyltransferase family 4 protein [Gammaproteobacteria bacterium]|nr:glycosyltransferase family 4 protein [Gammaproteobacteria bacterium]
MVEAQLEVGLDVLAVSSPFQSPDETGARVERFGGIAYYRSHNLSGGLRVSEKDQGLGVKIRKMLKLFSFADFLHGLGTRERPDVIHAHSTFFCAFAAHRVARRLRVPFVYEIRSLWEERSVMKSPSIKTRAIAKFLRVVETQAMRMADHVVVISEGLRDDVLSRGIPAERITLVANAVNLSRVSKDRATVTTKAPSNWIFGYVGSLSDIEGLDLLIEAVGKLRQQGWHNELHIHGDGPAISDLRRLAVGIEGIEFYGRFHPEDVSKIYGSVDVVVNPRRRSELTDKVTPLKPLEAMAWRKPVITSSVAGMLELVRQGETGFVFEADDAEALREALLQVTISQDVLRITESARHFVRDERSWRSNGLMYKTLYAQLTRADPTT